MEAIASLRRWMGAVLRAQRNERELQALRQSADAMKDEHAALSRRLSDLADGVAEAHRAFDTRHAAAAQEQRRAVESAAASARAAIDEVRDETHGRIAQAEAAATEAATVLNARTTRAEQSIAALDGELKRIAPPFPDVPRVPGGQGALMAVFEEMFRGTVPEIRDRLARYVDDAVEAVTRTGCRAVVDLGCGRGEWLELMRARDIAAAGVETSAKMVEVCKSAGHDVHEADALAFLRGASSASYAAVTAFQVVEHLPIATVLAIAIEAARVLAPGGILILETPNPDNVIVGSNTFWLDPTHLRPLPARLLRFFAEASGFDVIDVRVQGPDPAIETTADQEGWPAGVKHLLGGPRDYAIIARKPGT